MKKTRTPQKLNLSKETLRSLSEMGMQVVAAGATSFMAWGIA